MVGRCIKEDHFSRITEHFYSKDYRSHRPKDYPSANDTDDLPGCAVWLDDANKIFPGERTWHFKDVPYKVDVDVCDPGCAICQRTKMARWSVRRYCASSIWSWILAPRTRASRGRSASA